MIQVKQSVSIASRYGLKACLFDDVKQQAIAYFYDEELANVVAHELNLHFGFDANSMQCLSKSQGG
jgi:hypothetical protein